MSLETKAQGYLINDSTYCTSIEEIKGWANDKTLLIAEKNYLKEQLQNSRINEHRASADNEALEQEYKHVKRKLLWTRFREPFGWAIGFLAGYGVAKL